MSNRPRLFSIKLLSDTHVGYIVQGCIDPLIGLAKGTLSYCQRNLRFSLVMKLATS